MEFARHVPNLRHLRMLQAIGEENGVSGAARRGYWPPRNPPSLRLC